MSDERLSYPMARARALVRGLMLGAPLGAGQLMLGTYGRAFVLVALFTGAGYLLARLLLTTVVRSGGFTLQGWHEYDWADVADASAAPEGLSLRFRNGAPTVLPPDIVRDPVFRSALARWLPDSHPARRALEG